FSSRRRHTSSLRDWSSDVCSSDLPESSLAPRGARRVELAHLGGDRKTWLDNAGLPQRRHHGRRGNVSPPSDQKHYYEFFGGQTEIGRASCRERVYSPGGYLQVIKK